MLTEKEDSLGNSSQFICVCACVGACECVFVCVCVCVHVVNACVSNT